MTHYFAVVWDTESSSQHDFALEATDRLLALYPDWSIGSRGRGVFVAFEPRPDDVPILFDGDRSLILGTLFRSAGSSERPGTERVTNLSDAEAAYISQSKGRSLTSSFWGAYIAFIRTGQSVVTLRAPVTQTPCFFTRVKDVWFICSHVVDIYSLGFSRVSINWDSIVAQIAGGDFLNSETALDGVSSLDCGACLHIEDGEAKVVEVWSPRQFLDRRQDMSFEEATRSIRIIVDSCVEARASVHRRILCTLSGGLDSSIVASALARARSKPVVSCVNYSSRGTGDERVYARAMAEYAQLPLVEQARNESVDLRVLLECAPTARPVLSFSGPDVDRRNADLASSLRASAIFDGELGDNLFGNCPTIGALVTCLHFCGLRPKFLSYLVDYAVLNRLSIWRCMRECWKETKLESGVDLSLYSESQRGLGADFASSLLLTSQEAVAYYLQIRERFQHPWFSNMRRAAPDTFGLLYGLIVATSTTYHAPFERAGDASRVSPFVSQPLIEAGFLIPSYLNFQGGEDRAVARAAFRDVLPRSVLARWTGKGGPDLWARDAVEHNAAFLRELLLDGFLAANHLIDCQKVETILSPRWSKSTAMITDIFVKAYIEAWLRRWVSGDARAMFDVTKRSRNSGQTADQREVIERPSAVA